LHLGLLPHFCGRAAPKNYGYYVSNNSNAL
jgi:hypothetical protein